MLFVYENTIDEWQEGMEEDGGFTTHPTESSFDQPLPRKWIYIHNKVTKFPALFSFIYVGSPCPRDPF